MRDMAYVTRFDYTRMFVERKDTGLLASLISPQSIEEIDNAYRTHYCRVLSSPNILTRGLQRIRTSPFLSMPDSESLHAAEIVTEEAASEGHCARTMLKFNGALNRKSDGPGVTS